MFAVSLHGGRECQHRILRSVLAGCSRVCGGDFLEFRFAPGQGSGLVEQHDIDCPHALQRHPVLDQDARPGGALGGDGDDERDGKAEGVGAGDDQDRHGAGDRVS